jgi:1-acyl-sn-glycerol-3-phosphate acyltransferase
MSILRRFFRIPALIIWYLFIILMSIPSRFMGDKGSPGIAALTSLCMVGASRIVNLKLKLKGSIPRNKPGLIVSNHLGYVDLLVQGALAPIKVTPKSDVAKWPFIGLVVASARPIWIQRSSKKASAQTASEFSKAIKQGICLLVYPEGTSSDGKSGVLPFKSTAFEAAIISQVPIYPVHIRYKQSEVPYHGDMDFGRHLWYILGLPGIDAEVRVLKPILPGGSTRKELAERTRQAIAEVDRRSSKKETP